MPPGVGAVQSVESCEIRGTCGPAAGGRERGCRLSHHCCSAPPPLRPRAPFLRVGPRGPCRLCAGESLSAAGALNQLPLACSCEAAAEPWGGGRAKEEGRGGLQGCGCDGCFPQSRAPRPRAQPRTRQIASATQCHVRCHHGCTVCCPRVSARVLSVQCCAQLHCCTHSTHLASDVRVPVPHVPWQRGRWNLGVEWGFVWEGGQAWEQWEGAPLARAAILPPARCMGRSWRAPSPRPSPSLLS